MAGWRLVPEARADLFPEARAVKGDEGTLWADLFCLQPKAGGQEGTKLQGQLEIGPGRGEDDKL